MIFESQVATDLQALIIVEIDFAGADKCWKYWF
jgi:hypothetical protein